MADLHDDTAGAEQPGFLQKIKDTLHIGQQHKDEHVATPDATPSLPVSSKSTTATGAADVPAAPPGHHPTTDLNSLAGHEAEHHGGVPTFLVALPDQDIPDEVTKEAATSDVTGESGGQGGGSEFFDSEEVFSKAQEGEHHEGVPTFLVALPGEDMPDDVTKEKLHHVEELHHPGNKDLDSEELFSNAQQGEHHGGVPTFLVALPDQEIPQEDNKEVVGGKADDAKDGFDSEEVFSKAQKGEHHEGVPTFLVALPDQDMPDEGTKEKLHHVSAQQD